MTTIRPGGIGPAASRPGPLPLTAPAGPADSVSLGAPGLDPTLVRLAPSSAAPPAPPVGMLAVYRPNGQEMLRVPVDLEERDRVLGAEDRAFLSGKGSSFLELSPDGTTRLALQAPPESRFAFGMRHEGAYWLRTDREVLVVDDSGVKGRHAFAGQPGFQRRIHPTADGGMYLLDGDRVVRLGADASVQATHAAPWRPTELSQVGGLNLLADRHPGNLRVLRGDAEVPLSDTYLEESAVADADGTVWFLEGQNTRNAPKTLVRVDPKTLECTRTKTEIDARRLVPLPGGGLLVHVQESLGERLVSPSTGHSVELGKTARLTELFVGDGKAVALVHAFPERGTGLEYRVLSLDLATGATSQLWAAKGDAPVVTVEGGQVSVLTAAGDSSFAGEPVTARFRPAKGMSRVLSRQEALGEAAVRFGLPDVGAFLGGGWSYDPADGCMVRLRDLGSSEVEALDRLRSLEGENRLARESGLERLFDKDLEYAGLPGVRLEGDARTVKLAERLVVGVPDGTTLTAVVPVTCSGQPFAAVMDSRSYLYWVDCSSSSAGYARFQVPLPGPRLLVEPDRLVGFGEDGSVMVYRPALGEGRRLEGPASTRLVPEAAQPPRPGGRIEQGEAVVRIGDIELPRR